MVITDTDAGTCVDIKEYVKTKKGWSSVDGLFIRAVGLKGFWNE